MILEQVVNMDSFRKSKWKDSVEVKCHNCNKIYLTSKRRIQSKVKTSKFLFCSQKCCKENQRNGILVKCKRCEKEFYKEKSWFNRGNNHFCSKICSNRSNSRWENHIKKVKLCQSCNEKIHPRNRNHLCHKCHRRKKKEELQNMTIREFQNYESVKGKHPSWVNANIRNLCRAWNSNTAVRRCQFCGYEKHIEFCHIKAISEFDLDTELKIVNAPENILLLCPNHHWEFDNKIIQISDMKQKSDPGAARTHIPSDYSI